MHIKYALGFSIVELMLVVVLITIVSLLSVPSYNAYLKNSQSSILSTSLTQTLARARSEAIKQNIPVTVCSADVSFTDCDTQSDWVHGWITFINPDRLTKPNQSDDIIAIYQSPYQVSLKASQTIATYEPTGFSESATANMTFQIVPNGCTGNHGRFVTIKNVGRVEVSRTACP